MMLVDVCLHLVEFLLPCSLVINRKVLCVLWVANCSLPLASNDIVLHDACCLDVILFLMRCPYPQSLDSDFSVSFVRCFLMLVDVCLHICQLLQPHFNAEFNVALNHNGLKLPIKFVCIVDSP